MQSLRTIALCVALAACTRATSDAPRRGAYELTVPRVAAGAVRIDGVLDEPVWRRARGTGALTNPSTGAPEAASRVQGEAWFAWDDTALYFAARVRDASPERPFAPDAVDPHLWERSSAVELMLQPGDRGDNRHYYELQADTACAKWTTRFDDYNAPRTRGPDGVMRFGHQEWEPTLQCASRVGGEGYVIELALPWRDLDGASRATVPPRAGDRWRANVYSFRDGQSDSLAWSPLRGEGNFHFARRFGALVFGGD